MTPAQLLELADLRCQAQAAHLFYLRTAREYGVTAIYGTPIDEVIDDAARKLTDLQIDRSLARTNARRTS